MRHNDRLIFPHCRRCVVDFPEGGWNPDYRCTHTDKQRSWVASLPSNELARGLEEGYTITRVMTIFAWDQSDDNLLRPYIREFMAQKIHASGFGKGILGNTEAEERFIRECAEFFDIKIDRRLMKKNKGRRALAKLLLNNLCEFNAFPIC
jgi:hypothetical protein